MNIYIVYETTNLVNNKKYIGVHKTSEMDDNYFGSGNSIKAAIKKYGRENFSRKALFTFDNRKDAFKKESEIVTEDFIKDDTNYNIATGGGGSGEYKKGEDHHWWGKTHSEETRRKMSKSSSGENNPWYGKTPPQMIEAQKRQKGQNHPMYGKTHTEDTKQKMSKAKIGLYDGENNPMYNKKHSKETKEKISKKTSEFLRNRPKITCPHCGKLGQDINMKRYHFDKCKLAKSN